MWHGVKMRYVWMITDSAADYEPPMLFSSKKKAIARMEKLLEETMDEFSYELTKEEKDRYRNEFKKNGKTFFNLFEDTERHFKSRLLWARSCSLTKEFVW